MTEQLAISTHYSDQQKQDYLRWYIQTLIDERAKTSEIITEQYMLDLVGPYGMKPSRRSVLDWFSDPQYAELVLSTCAQVEILAKVVCKTGLLPGLQNMARMAATGRGLAAVQATRLLWEIDRELAQQAQDRPQSSRAGAMLARFRGRVSVSQHGAEFFFELEKDQLALDEKTIIDVTPGV